MSQALVLSFSTAMLVFGLEWYPLIGADHGRLARRIARKHRASHVVFSGPSAAAVGVARLRREHTHRGPVLHSAAQCVAQLHPEGTLALMHDIAEAGVWLVAVHDGAVVAGTDKVLASREEAELLVEELSAAYPGMRIIKVGDAAGAPMLAELSSACAPPARLQPLSRWRPWLPWPVQCLALALVLALLVPRAWSMLGRDSAAPKAAHAGDSLTAWQQAITASAKRHIVHGVSGTRALLNIFFDLPVHPGGWTLHQAECNAKGQQWLCQATFHRRRQDASNDSLLAALPREGVVEFPTLDQAVRQWHAATHGLPLAGYRVRSRVHTESVIYTGLQGIRPGFGQLQAGKPYSLPLTVPLDAQGAALARPAGITSYGARSLQISGPLRSATLLLPHAQSMAWKKAVLTLRHTDKPDLTRSALVLALHGVLYETDNATDPLSAEDPAATLALRSSENS